MLDLSALDPDQRVAVEAPRGPVAILAGAGTGKTRTITYRIADLIERKLASPQKILAVTFTRKAAGEMRERLKAMGIPNVQAQTFHSAAWRQLGYFWPRFAGKMRWQLLQNNLAQVRLATEAAGISVGKEALFDIREEIDWAKAMLISPQSYSQHSLGRDLPISDMQFMTVFQEYESAKYQGDKALLDYNDLLMHMVAALEKSTSIATEFREQYRTFVVDEYHDVTPLQQRLLQAWLGNRDDLTVVGDANQTIYTFNGATPDYLLNFSRTYRNATVVRLERDYRSTPDIADLANQVIGQARGRVAGSRLELIGQRPEQDLPPQFHSYVDDNAEADAVAQEIQRLIRSGVSAHEIAILYRTNSQSERFEEALTRHGISYRVHGNARFFDRPEIKEALVRLRKYSTLPGGDNDLSLELKVRKILEAMGHGDQRPSGKTQLQRWNSLEALVGICLELDKQHSGLSLSDLVTALDARAAQQREPKTAEVVLASLHAAKGLEWDAVFLVSANEGNLPFVRALHNAEQVEEERRLFYVGITRARLHLYISWTTQQTKDGSPRARTRFLDNIPGAVITHAASQEQQGSLPKNCTRCHKLLHTQAERIRGRCEHCTPVDSSEAIAALRQWRRNKAQQRGIPSSFIFSDAVLHAIVLAQPTITHDLLAIPGMGPVKVEDFGAEIIQVLSIYNEQ